MRAGLEGEGGRHNNRMIKMYRGGEGGVGVGGGGSEKSACTLCSPVKISCCRPGCVVYGTSKQVAG